MDAASVVLALGGVFAGAAGVAFAKREKNVEAKPEPAPLVLKVEPRASPRVAVPEWDAERMHGAPQHRIVHKHAGQTQETAYPTRERALDAYTKKCENPVAFPGELRLFDGNDERAWRPPVS